MGGVGIVHLPTMNINDKMVELDMQYPMTVDKDKEIQEAAKNLVIELEHLLSLVGDYSNPRYYRCSMCKRKLSNHQMASFVKTESIFKEG